MAVSYTHLDVYKRQDVMTAVCEKFGHKVNYEYAICGADAIDKVGDPFPLGFLRKLILHILKICKAPLPGWSNVSYFKMDSGNQ